MATAHKLRQERAALVTPDTLVVATSKSGSTNELLDLSHASGADAALIGIVNQLDLIVNRFVPPTLFRQSSFRQTSGRQYDIACGQIDIGNAVTPMTERMTKGVLQPDGSTRVEPRMDVDAVANAIVYMDSLPLDANVQFMTVMATKMPFVGRG